MTADVVYVFQFYFHNNPVQHVVLWDNDCQKSPNALCDWMESFGWISPVLVQHPKDLSNNKHLRTNFFMWLRPSWCSDLFILYSRFYVLCASSCLIFQQFGGLIWKWHLPCVCIFSDDPTAWAVLLAACHAENTVVHLHNKQSKQTHLEKMIVTAISAKSKAALLFLITNVLTAVFNWNKSLMKILVHWAAAKFAV